MIIISLANEVPCEKICQKIQKEVHKWIKDNGNDLSNCVLNIKLAEISHTVDNAVENTIIEITSNG